MASTVPVLFPVVPAVSVVIFIISMVFMVVAPMAVPFVVMPFVGLVIIRITIAVYIGLAIAVSGIRRVPIIVSMAMARVGKTKPEMAVADIEANVGVGEGSCAGAKNY